MKMKQSACCKACGTATKNSTQSATQRKRSATRCISQTAIFQTVFCQTRRSILLDEAGSRVKLRQAMLPDEVSEVQKRVKFITHRMETAIANHEFEKARFYSEEERKEKEHLRMLREKLKIDDSSTGIVTREDIEEVVARWTGIQVFESRKTNNRNCCASKKSCIAGSSARISPSPLWHERFAAAARV